MSKRKTVQYIGGKRVNTMWGSVDETERDMPERFPVSSPASS